MYWGIIDFIWEHQRNTVWKRPYNLHQTIKKYIGYTEPIYNSNGVEVGTTLKSTDFKRMSQKDFNEYMDNVLNFIWEEIVPLNDDMFERELCNMTGVSTLWNQTTNERNRHV